MSTLKESLLEQLDRVLAAYDNFLGQPAGPIRKQAINEFAFRAVSAIERADSKDSSRAEQARKIAGYLSMEGHPQASPDVILGIVKSVRGDVDGDYLEDSRTLIRAEVFSDLMEQAEYLLTEGYKDPAALMVSGVLESHLRNLCAKAGVDVNESDGRPKRAGKMNDDLVRAKVYSPLEQKEVITWLGLRNHAAHAEWGKYDAGQVKTMLDGVREFIIRRPA